MKDAFGEELNVGDRVIFARAGWRRLTKGSIVKINSKMITIEYDLSNGRLVQTSMYSHSYVAKVYN